MKKTFIGVFIAVFFVGCTHEVSTPSSTQQETSLEQNAQQALVKKYDGYFGVKNSSEDKMLFLYQNAREKY